MRARLPTVVTRIARPSFSPPPSFARPTFGRLPIVGWVLAILLLAGAATGQQRYNLLAVDNALLDAAGPYYFIDWGNSSDAFAKALPFGEALGLEVEFEDATKTLVFRRGATTARLRATADVDAGLEKRSDVMTVDGAPFARPVPQAILVDGSSYVAITPIAEAFGAAHDWLPEERLLTVDLPPEPTVAVVGAPRVGIHDGYVRVAIDLPGSVPVTVRAGAAGDAPGGTLIVRLPGSALPPIDRSFADGPLARLYGATLDGAPALVLESRHALAPDGAGYRFAETESGTFYVDVGAGLSGPAVEALRSTGDAALAVAPAEPIRKTVVIDAGHGGHDPGALSRYAREETVVLAVALELRDLLEARGVEVILTRDRDEFIELTERADFASTDRNVFLSIHANSAYSSDAHGIETYVFGRPLDPRLIEIAIKENGGGELGRARTEEILAAGDDLVRNILRENQLQYSRSFAETVQSVMVDATGAHDRGIKELPLLVLRNARIPAILVEIGFVNHPEEGKRLADAAYQATVAEALADGVTAFLGSGTSAARP